MDSVVDYAIFGHDHFDVLVYEEKAVSSDPESVNWQTPYSLHSTNFQPWFQYARTPAEIKS
jgi:hypothetical protein